MSAMDAYLADWHASEVETSLPPFDRPPLGLENELMEILWQNGEAVLHSQNNRRPRSGHPVPWIDEDEAPAILSHLIEPHKLSGNSDVEEAFRFPPFDPVHLPPLAAAGGEREQGFVAEPSVMTVEELSHGSNGVNKSCLPVEMDDNESCRKVGNVEKEANFGGCASSQSNDNSRNKRKTKDVEEAEYPSEASQMESPRANNQSSQKRRTRVAEVHNQSERRRRDRINEKMRALQELVPHSHRSDKASMLDDAIEYMKTLQLQLQWWMGSGMAQMRMLQCIYQLPTLGSVQNLVYMSKTPQFVGQPMNQQPMSHGFVVSPFNFQNQILQPEKNPEYFEGHHFVAANPQPMNAFNFSSQVPPKPHNRAK